MRRVERRITALARHWPAPVMPPPRPRPSSGCDPAIRSRPSGSHRAGQPGAVGRIALQVTDQRSRTPHRGRGCSECARSSTIDGSRSRHIVGPEADLIALRSCATSTDRRRGVSAARATGVRHQIDGHVPVPTPTTGARRPTPQPCSSRRLGVVGSWAGGIGIADSRRCWRCRTDR